MIRPIRLALAAAAACASSRCSSAARHPDTSHHRTRSSSGSIRHEPEDSPHRRARANRLIARSRVSVSRAHQTSHHRLPPCTANHKCAFTPRSNPYSNNQHSCPATAPGCTHSVLYSQIPIARHRCSCPISRGFVPWRLSDDGPAAARITHSGAVVRNPSHERTSAVQQNVTRPSHQQRSQGRHHQIDCRFHDSSAGP